MNGVVKEGSIGEILFKSHIITEEELKAALEAQKVSGCRVGEALVRLGAVTQEDIDWALANQLNIPYVRLKKENVDPAAVAKVPAELARRYGLCPIFLSGNELAVAMSDPLNKEALDELKKASGCRVSISVGLIREIREMHDLMYGPDEHPPELGFVSAQFSEKVLASINADLSGATLLNHLLLRVVQHKLAFLSLQPMGEQVRMLGKRDGRIVELGWLPATCYERLTARVRRLSGLPASAANPTSGVLNFLWQGKRIPFQALLMPGNGGEYVTLRLHVSAPQLCGIDDLRLSSSKRDDFLALAAEKEGVVLFSGREIEERGRLMDVFLESCDFSDRTVLLIGERVGRGKKRFPRLQAGSSAEERAAVVAAALDHDPDVLVIEDATDLPVFVAASKAVMRGKLVLAGVAHRDKVEVLKQLLHLSRKNFLIPTHMKGVISMRSVLLLCPHCRKQYAPPPEEVAALRLAALRLAALPTEYFRPAGCPACDQTGYREKTYLMDVIRFDQGILDAFELIRDGAEIIRHLKDGGYRGITEEGTDLLQRGEISPGEYVASILL